MDSAAGTCSHQWSNQASPLQPLGCPSAGTDNGDGWGSVCAPGHESGTSWLPGSRLGFFRGFRGCRPRPAPLAGRGQHSAPMLAQPACGEDTRFGPSDSMMLPPCSHHLSQDWDGSNSAERVDINNHTNRDRLEDVFGTLGASQQACLGISTGGTTRLIFSCSNRSTWVFFDSNDVVQAKPTMLTADVPLQVVQPGRTLAPPQRVLAVRMWAEPYCSWSKPGMLVLAVLRDVLAILSTGTDRAFSSFPVRLEVLARGIMSVKRTRSTVGHGSHTPTCPPW